MSCVGLCLGWKRHPAARVDWWAMKAAVEKAALLLHFREYPFLPTREDEQSDARYQKKVNREQLANDILIQKIIAIAKNVLVLACE